MVRESGHDLYGVVSRFSTQGCQKSTANWGPGKVVSGDMDVALLVGEVGSSHDGLSANQLHWYGIVLRCEARGNYYSQPYDEAGHDVNLNYCRPCL